MEAKGEAVSWRPTVAGATCECTRASSPTGTSMETTTSHDYRSHSHREPGVWAPCVAGTRTGCCCAHGTRRAPQADDRVPSYEAQHYKDWASPAEVMQLRAICTDIANKHKNETAALRNELKEMQSSRDALMLEVEGARRLHEACVKAESEHEKARREYSRWEEEREVLRLQLQRLTLENQQLRRGASHSGRDRGPFQQGLPHHYRQPVSDAAQSGSSVIRPSASVVGAADGSSIPTPSLMSGSGTQVVMNDSRSQRQPQQRMHQSRTQSIDSANGVASTGSVTTAEVAYSTNSNTNTPSSNNNISSNNPSGCTSDRPGTCGSELCLREHLRLTEELNRTLTAYAELEARSHFAQTLWELSAAREAQHSLMLVAENDRLRGQVNHWRAVAEDTTGQLEAANAQLRNCRDDLHETQQSLQASIASAAAAITAERKEAEEAIAVLKAGHAAELSQVRLQLEQALDDNIRSREVLQKTIESSQKSAEAQRAQLESDAAVAEQRAAGALQAKYEIEVALAEMAAQRSSEREGFERELLILQSANRRCVEEKTKQASELRLLRESYSSVEVHLHEVEAELERVSGQLRGALDKVMQSAKLEDELEITRTRVAVAEKELGEQREHYEEKIRLQLEAFAKLQRERDADVLRLERDIQRLRRRCESGKIKLAAVLKGMAGADRQPCQTHIQATIGSDGRSENGCGVVEEPLRCDAVALLKQSTAVACMLSSTIRRGITQP